jgi:4-carboxymuconolactone decarboxylase
VFGRVVRSVPMSRLPSLHQLDLNDEALAIWQRISHMSSLEVFTADGGLSGPFNAFLYAPEIGARLADLGTALLTKASVPRRTAELMVITVAARWKSEFEWYAHAAMARDNGISNEVIAAIGSGAEPTFETDEDAVMYNVARQLAETGRLDNETYGCAERIVGRRGLVEVIALCGFYTLISFLLNGFEVSVPPAASPMWST